MNKFPKQRLSYKEKIANDHEWCRSVMDSIITNHSSDFTLSNTSSDYYRMLSNYQLFNNVLNQKDFERECEPLGLEVGQYADEVKPYNKTYNKIQVLLGEELKRSFRYRAVLVNEDGIKSKLKHRDELLRQYVLNTLNQELGQEGMKTLDPLEIQRYMSTTYLDSRETVTNKLLNYYAKYLDIPDKKNDGYKHLLISGYEAAYVGIDGEVPTIDIVNPLGLYYHKSSEVKYIQDGMYVGYRTYMTSADVLNRFGEHLTKEQLDQVDKTTNGAFGDKETSQILWGNVSNIEGSYGRADSTNDWLVHHVEWVSKRRVGFLEKTNLQTKEVEKVIVSEEYEPPITAVKLNEKDSYGKLTQYYNWVEPGDIVCKLHYTWIDEVWEGVKIGESIYTMMGPKRYQFRSLDDPRKVRLGYHGIALSSMNAPVTSPMDRMKPFQYLLFVVMHKLKRFIAQDRGRIFNLPSTTMDPKLGWDKSLYYLTQLGINIYDPLQHADTPGFGQTTAPSSTDWSTSQYIANYMQLVDAIDQQISDVAGVSRQREGQALPNEAVTNAQSNIATSSTITEVYFQAHDKLWEKILSSFCDIVIECYKGKDTTKQFVLDDLSIETINVSPSTFSNAQMGVFISDSPKDEQIFKSLNEVSQALIQNDKVSFSNLIKMFRTNSPEQLEEYIEASEKEALTQAQQAQQAQMDLQRELQENQKEFELQKLRAELDTKVLIAKINATSSLQDRDEDGTPDTLEVEKFKHQVDIDNRKLELAKQKASQSKK